ncbi:MAG: methyltransferase [Rhodospirillaceae bacterium]|nr:methyltransferase [Rhodospirillaceae bacterium]
MAMDERARTAAVYAQYEAYPYPARDPADEAKRLITGSPSHLLEIAHYLNQGHFDPKQPFRALVAGGGTGDAAIMLAQQLADEGADQAEVTYLDPSASSRGIAEARARVRGLDNIRFLSGEIEAVEDLCPNCFDYIDCCGVLHHLVDPVKGLRSLVSKLAENGGMGLMVYGALGRRGVYDVQEAMRLMADSNNDEDRISLVRRLLDGLPVTHWLRRNPFVGDYFQGGDAGLTDLLLHRRDRAYTVPEVMSLLGSSGLRPVSFVAPAQYDPSNYLVDPALVQRGTALAELDQWALAERLSGAITKHIIYVVKIDRHDNPVAELGVDWLSIVPIFRDLDPSVISKGIHGGGELKADLAPGHSYRALLPALAPEIAARIDGNCSLAALWKDLRESGYTSLTDNGFLEQFDLFLRAFGPINRLLLRRP